MSDPKPDTFVRSTAQARWHELTHAARHPKRPGSVIEMWTSLTIGLLAGVVGGIDEGPEERLVLDAEARLRREFEAAAVELAVDIDQRRRATLS